MGFSIGNLVGDALSAPGNLVNGLISGMSGSNYTPAPTNSSYKPTSYSAPAQQPVQAAPNTAPSAQTGSVLGASTTAAQQQAAQNAQLGQIYQGLYDNEINNLQNQYNSLPAYQDEATGSINMQYTPQYNTLQTQNATGNANLDLAQNQLDTQKSQGIRNIGNSLRSALNGYQNQIGVMGAGNSSAAPLLGYALSQQGNRQMADMNTQYGQQQTGINQQRKDLAANFQNQVDSLNAWKQSNLNDIAARYSQMQQQLQNQIMGAKGDEARYLAVYGQTALAQQALSSMQNLEAQYKDQVGQLNSHFQQVAAPQTDLSKYTGQYQINPFSIDNLSPLSFGNNQATPDDTSATASLVKRPDQSPNLASFGF